MTGEHEKTHDPALAAARANDPVSTQQPPRSLTHGEAALDGDELHTVAVGFDQQATAYEVPARYEDAIPQIADVGVPDALRSEIEARMRQYPDRKSATIPCMAAAQRLHGWLSPEAIRQVAAVMRVTPAYLQSVASFYDMFDLEPKGEHTIYMCTNISCMLRGADAVLRALEEAAGTENGGVSDTGIYLREFECLGACDIAPMASVDGHYVGPLTPDDAKALVEDLLADREVLPDKQLSKRPMAATLWQGGTPLTPPSVERVIPGVVPNRGGQN